MVSREFQLCLAKAKIAAQAERGHLGRRAAATQAARAVEFAGGLLAKRRDLELHGQRLALCGTAASVTFALIGGTPTPIFAFAGLVLVVVACASAVRVDFYRRLIEADSLAKEAEESLAAWRVIGELCAAAYVLLARARGALASLARLAHEVESKPPVSIASRALPPPLRDADAVQAAITARFRATA